MTSGGEASKKIKIGTDDYFKLRKYTKIKIHIVKVVNKNTKRIFILSKNIAVFGQIAIDENFL